MFSPLAVPSGPPFATIEASSNEVRGGDIFKVTCTVLGEPEMNVSFSWMYPGQVSVTSIIFPLRKDDLVTRFAHELLIQVS